MADIPRTDVKKEPEPAKPENGKIEVVQGNIDIVMLKFLESINNNLNSIRTMLETYMKDKK